MIRGKKPRISKPRSDYFDGLPDDIVVSILTKLSSSASCPADFVSVLMTCRRLNRLGLNPLVLSSAGPETLAVRAGSWSEFAHRFLKQCVTAGSNEACYILGMIRFYCLKDRESGASLMAKAAMRSHAEALYSLAVIQFNGSGGDKKDKDLRAGVALCARAAALGHTNAIRELGHCLQDGYGVPQNVAEGRRILIQANAREFALLLRVASLAQTHPDILSSGSGTGHPLLSDFGCGLAPREAHPASRFLTEWFGSWKSDPGLRMCSYSGCGRPETRSCEFRRCSACSAVNYCSRGCQAQDWRVRHGAVCTPMLEHAYDHDDVADRRAEI
ncbi:F-box protein At1g67340-like [Diospyros lotus]|uniref:F-box protein At1g67340-like n=1 Tax=Diospyros lotus TaxID=55363 RepID=UPI00225A9211|nr:F-box protein At1g67340-like [Diospyros lotus]